MARYIDADLVQNCLDTLSNENLIGNENDTYISLPEAKDKIEELPTADVVEVRYGRWVYYDCVCSYDGLKSGYACSVCNAFVDEEIFDTDEFHKDFCGNCGAKMDGKE